MTARTTADLEREIEELRLRLGEAEQTLEAIRAGEVDSLLVETPDGLRVYALEGASHSYRVLIEAISEGAATLTEAGVVLYCNGALARMLGRPLQRVMGSSIHEHVSPSSRAALDALLRAAEEDRARGELHLEDAGGKEVPAYLSVSAIESEGRRLLCLVAVDLRAQKRSDEILAAERLASSVLHQAAEAIVVCDENGRIVRASDTAARLCAGNPLFVPFDEAFPIIVASESAEVSEGGLARAALGGATFRATPGRMVRRDGHRADLLVSAGPLHAADHRVIGCVVTLVDVTEHRQAVQALAESEKRLREADRRKDEFLAVLSHELRNPLAPMVTALHILDHGGPGPRVARAQQVIARQVRQLERIVDDLLDVTRIARGKIDLRRERLELNQLVATVAEDYRSLFERHGVGLEVRLSSDATYLWADAARLAQVIGNLLQNAAKFAGHGEHTTVSVTRAASQRRGIVRVADTGSGVPRDVLPRLFEPFIQADMTLDRNKGGLGLGLALVKGIVELHGGEVTAWSEGPGRGAEFTVCLPLHEQPLAPEPRPAQRSSGRGRRILIIEDNVDAAESLRDALELGAHEIEVAYSGSEGLARANELRPEVVLCDIGLPGMDGYEVARAFRESEALRPTYLVALTGYASDEDSSRARAAGFDQHMPKPPDLEKLEDVLVRVPPRTGGTGVAA